MTRKTDIRKSTKKNRAPKRHRRRTFYEEDFDELEDYEDDYDVDIEEIAKVFKTVDKQRKRRMTEPAPESLVGKCLVHIGDTDNELYKQSVIYITECSPDMVRGVMINKLLFGTATIECKTKNNDTVLRNVYEDLYQGGPENPAHGVVIFPTEDDTADDPFADILGEVSISTSFGVLQEILDGVGPSRKIIAMGHCLWRRGELEWQLFNNQWLIVPCSLKLLFDTKFEDRWELAKQESGVYKGAYITPQIGLA